MWKWFNCSRMRPKMSVAPPLRRSEAQRSQVEYPTLLDVVQSRGRIPGARPRSVEAKRAVKLENGGVMHIRAPKDRICREDHNGVEPENERAMHKRAQEEAMSQEDHPGVELENGRVMHTQRAQKEAMFQEDHHGVEPENGGVMHRSVKKEAVWQEDHIGVEHARPQEETLERMPSLLGGGPSSLNMEIGGEDLAGSDQDLAPEEAVRGRGMPQADQGTQNFRKHQDDAQFACTACGHCVPIVEVRAHPVLHVGVCAFCYDFLFSSPFTKDNPHDPFEHENECRWCGDGGEVILCDFCPKAFCKLCIKRNFGEEILKTIESPGREWSCFVCDDDHLQTLIHDYNNVENLVKTMNRSGQPRKSRTSRVSNPRMRSRGTTRRFRNQTAIASETLATIIARKQEDLQRRFPETNFTGFERPQHHRQPQRHFPFAHNNTKREHVTPESGDPIPEGRFQ